MEITIDIDRLRHDLADDSYAGAFAGIPTMIMEAWDIERLSDEEAIHKALQKGINLFEYQV